MQSSCSRSTLLIRTCLQTFLGSSKPLTLTATLDSEIYYVGQPITLQYVVGRSDRSSRRGARLTRVCLGCRVRAGARTN